MAQIKSALEIALARTEGVASDKEGLKNKELEDRGKKIASEFLNDHQDAGKFKKELEASSGKEKEIVLKGAREVLLGNFILPAYDDFSGALKTLQEGFSVVYPGSKELPRFFEEVGDFFQQYCDGRKQLIEAIKAQLVPLAKSKSQQLAAQTGMQVELSPEELPEFSRAYRENMAQMTDQYKEALDRIKATLENL